MYFWQIIFRNFPFLKSNQEKKSEKYTEQRFSVKLIYCNSRKRIKDLKFLSIIYSENYQTWCNVQIILTLFGVLIDIWSFWNFRVYFRKKSIKNCFLGIKIWKYNTIFFYKLSFLWIKNKFFPVSQYFYF